MNEVVQYGRLGIWVGAAVLLIEAILRRSGGLIGILAALLILAGLVSLVIGLAAGDRGRSGSTDCPPDFEEREEAG